MKPYKVNIYVYADSQIEVDELQNAVRDFVLDQRSKGVAVTASKLTSALRAFGSNQLITNYLR